MAKDNRADKLRNAIASKLKAHDREAKTQASSPQPASLPEGTVPKTSAMDVASQILKTQISIGTPKLQDLAHMCRQLATLIDVGIPLARALRIMSQRTQHPKLRNVMTMVHEEVEGGSTVASALEKHPKIIPLLIVNIVRIGETGGILEDSLRRLAEIYESKADMKRKVIAAISYPVAAICVAIGVLVLIFIYAIPVFAAVYSQKEGVELPKITQQVIGISDFLRTKWPLYVPLLIAIGVGAWYFGRTVAGRRIYDLLRLRLPIMGPLNTKVNLARFTRTLANLLSAGIPLMEALSATSNSSDNVIIAETLANTRDDVEQGGKMEDSLRASMVIPPIVVDMIAIGDEAGALDTVLGRMADNYEGEVETSLKGLVALIEPLLIIFLGGAVMVIAFAVLLPYWNIGDLIE